MPKKGKGVMEIQTFNSLIGIEKREPAQRFKIQKVDADQHLVFGWANISVTANGEEVEDLQEDVIEPEELERAAYEFVLDSRDGGEMHEQTGVATLVESVMLTPEKQTAMGIPPGFVPIGWWVGFKVTDEDVWQKVKSGEYSMFSIGGTAVRESIDDD